MKKKLVDELERSRQFCQQAERVIQTALCEDERLDAARWSDLEPFALLTLRAIALVHQTCALLSIMAQRGCHRQILQVMAHDYAGRLLRHVEDLK